MPLAPARPETSISRLTGDWRIVQLRRGHRFSTDDVITAWTGHLAQPHANALLDLGAGVGSIGLMLLRLSTPAARLTMVEVQQVSAVLARQTVALNHIEARVTVHCADLRQWIPPISGQQFDLITANPPYLPPERAVASPNPQRAAARLELHGNVFDYCEAAARNLAAEGRFCLCHAAADPRPAQALAAAGLTLLSRQEVVFRADRPPMLALHVAAWEGQREDPPPLVVRDAAGHWTQTFLAVRATMGLEA